MNADTVLKTVGSALVGLLLGWGANALTLSGRVTAIEATLIRIEARLYPAAVASVTPSPAPTPAKQP
jgi:hypothetical protein